MIKHSSVKFKYIILLVALILFAVLSTQLSIYTLEKTQSSYKILQKVIVNFFIYTLFGVILGGESLILHKKYVKYRFDADRFVLLVIPFFILSSVMVISISGLLPLRLFPLFLHQQFSSFFQIIFGYNLITSFICNKEPIK